MNISVGAAMKRLAAAVLTDRRALKAVGGTVLGLLVLILMPIAALLAVFNGDLEIDTERLAELVEAGLTDEMRAQIQFMDDTLSAIEEKMTGAGLGDRVREAQVLYTFALEEQSREEGFVDRLAGCFAPDQTAEQLAEAVNGTFGTDIDPEECP